MIIFYLLIFILGLVVGSFLNVVIYRLKTKEKIGKSRSRCPHCKKRLNWYELIPIISFIIQLGKCRKCKKNISWQYPLVEFFTGLIFALIFYFLFIVFDGYINSQFLVTLIFWFIISSFLIIVFVYDLKHYLVADIVIYTAIIISALYRLLEFFKFGHWNLIRNGKLEAGDLGAIDYFIAALITGIFFLIIILVSRGKWMGLGDVKIGILMGLVLGLPHIFVALFLAFLAGFVISIVLLILKKKTMKSEIPFGPFLVFATIISLFFGNVLINWYLGLI